MTEETITQEEYERLEKEFIKEQATYDKVNNKGMCGAWAWHIQKKREFEQKMFAEGRLKRK